VGAAVTPHVPQECVRFVPADLARWKPVIECARMSLD
jgi:hypothetical protein